jgi:hypothetical protein
MSNACRITGWILALAALAVGVARAAPAPQEKRWTQEELEGLSREISADLERLRGERFSRPVTVRVSSKADLIAYIKAREAKTDPPEKFAADEMVAKMLGVVPPDADLRARAYALLEAQVGGFYDPDTDSFSLMETLPLPLTKVTLAHELDHALDDQLFDIDGTLERLGEDTDAALAFHAVVEGSGTAMMTQWMLQAGDSLDLSAINESQMKELTSLAGAPDWVWKPLMASYMTGAGFLARADWRVATTKPLEADALRAAFERPPRSTEQVLHPEKYWDEPARDEPRRIVFDASKLGEDWKVLREDTLGELALAIVVTAPSQRDSTDFANPMALLGLEFTNDVAAGWGGDRLVLLGNGASRVLRWVTVWDGERDAGEFFGTMRQQLPHLEAAAQALSGEQAKDAGVTLEYGAARNEVVLTVRMRTGKSALKRLLRDLEHSLAG